MYGCRRRKTRENVSSHCVIKFISTKNAKVLDTGRKFVVNIKPMGIDKAQYIW